MKANKLGLLELLPLRFPFLMVDRILEYGDERAVALKNVSHDEWFFMGHFPGRPIMPGTLILEGMAQTAGILLMQLQPKLKSPAQGLLVGVDRARFRHQVVPGDQVVYEARLVKAHGRLYRVEAEAKVEGELVAEAVLSLMISQEDEAG